jgi:nitrate reductase cytochrome c-type subunit
MLTKNQELSRILIFKDKGKPGVRVAAELHKLAKSQRFKIETATDQSTLRQMLKNHTISAVVIDVGREIGDTLTIFRILEGFPTIPIFIFNGFLLPRIEEKAREYGHIHYSENHNNLDDFISMILAAVHKKKPSIIQGISLSHFLQLMNIEKWSGQVTVKAGDNQGVLLLQNGRLISVAAGERKGHAAWEEMAAWEKIIVETFAEQVPPNIPDSTLQKATLALKKSLSSHPYTATHQAGAGNIEILHLIRQNRKITLNLKKLNRAVAEIRDIFSASLLRTDIFLAEDGRSLAGWNSHPLACSQFAAITRSLKSALQISHFPAMGTYYLLDLDADQLLFVVVKDELQWGFLLKETKGCLGLLLNIILPKVLAILEDSIAIQHSV